MVLPSQHASTIHLELTQFCPMVTQRARHTSATSQEDLCRGHRPDDKEPREEVCNWVSLPRGRQAKEYKMSAEGMLPLIEWRKAPAGWKPRINNNENKKISRACQLGWDIWLVIRGACESINPSPSWISTLKHASLHWCRGTCWMSCENEWN